PDGAKDVPLNAKLRFVSCIDGTTWSLSDDITNTPISATESASGPTTVVTPEAPLTAETRYRFTVSRQSNLLASVSFFTGSARDDEAPMLTGVSTAKAFGGPNLLPFPNCSGGDSSSFTWPTVTDDATPGTALMLEGFLGDSPDSLGADPEVTSL